jgi:hypothetical protein
VTANAITFSVPTDAVGLPAGNYYVAAQFLDSHGNIVNTTNSMPMGVAPKIPTPPTYTLTPNAAGTLVTIDFGPEAQPNQTVTLGIGSNAASAETFESATGSLSFQFATLTPGSYLARLQVDGVDSPIGFTLSPPAFTGPFVVV